MSRKPLALAAILLTVALALAVSIAMPSIGPRPVNGAAAVHVVADPGAHRVEPSTP